jgi:hypothetical protein
MSESTTLSHPRSIGTAGPEQPWQQAYPGDLGQLRRLRADLRARLRGCPVADDAVQLLSELAANAALHSDSRRPGGTFIVRVQHDTGGHVRAEVQDDGSGWDGDLTAAAEPPHGLYLLTRLSSCYGVDRIGRGRVVWFHIHVRRDESATAGSSEC